MTPGSLWIPFSGFSDPFTFCDLLRGIMPRTAAEILPQFSKYGNIPTHPEITLICTTYYGKKWKSTCPTECGVRQ